MDTDGLFVCSYISSWNDDGRSNLSPNDLFASSKLGADFYESVKTFLLAGKVTNVMFFLANFESHIRGKNPGDKIATISDL